jgi:hypothetical protein
MTRSRFARRNPDNSCKQCGQDMGPLPLQFQFGGGRPPEYCAECRAERRRQQARDSYYRLGGWAHRTGKATKLHEFNDFGGAGVNGTGSGFNTGTGYSARFRNEGGSVSITPFLHACTPTCARPAKCSVGLVFSSMAPSRRDFNYRIVD